MSLWGRRVLVVDDDPGALAFASRVLESAGAHVVCTTGLGESLATVVGVMPDVLLVDVATEYGLALLRKVRTLSPEKGGCIPAAAASARAITEERVFEWRSAGFQRHVRKPFHAPELRNAVAALAGREVERRRGSRHRSEWPVGVSRERRLEERRLPEVAVVA